MFNHQQENNQYNEVNSQMNHMAYANYSSHITPSFDNDTYSGFFSGSSLSQSEFDESMLLSKEETKFLKKQKIGCSSSECTICFENYKKGDIIRNLPCGHKFHYKCMKPWLKTSKYCPLCRFDLKVFCKNKLEESQNNSYKKEHVIEIENSLKSSPLSLTEIKEVKEPITPTLIDITCSENEKNYFEKDLEISAIQMENLEENLEINNQIQDEKELRFRVMGFETESNVSFFGKQQEEEKINFGIEDHISEIGF